jgi:hypothetical protein
VNVWVDDDDVDIDLVLGLVCPDIHLVYNLTYLSFDSIWKFGSIWSLLYKTGLTSTR